MNRGRRLEATRLPAGVMLGTAHRAWCGLWQPEGVACTCGGHTDPVDLVAWWAEVAADQTRPLALPA